ncbi:hypothetical protein PLICRDRAFT_92893 [Plicaturopsis crispa FD-325 SS-3]|nr:hypothetical protein PLICRDRAFT_92893 [Plicaturopsis crispa FD-325 SS-3]
MPPVSDDVSPGDVRQALLRSAAYSRTLNPRNIEHLWYPLYDEVLRNLIGDIPTLVVAAQYPVWLNPTGARAAAAPANLGAEEEGPRDGDAPDEGFQVYFGPEPPTADGAPDDGDDGGEEMMEPGSISVAATAPAHRGAAFPDFAIVRLLPVDASDHWRYEGWRIAAVEPQIFVEQKRYISRSLPNSGHAEAFRVRFLEAEMDLLRQTCIAFVEHPSTTKIMGLSSSGPFWRTAWFTFRSQRKRSDPKLATAIRDQDYTQLAKFVRIDGWTDAAKIGSQYSDERFHRIRRRFEKKYGEDMVIVEKHNAKVREREEAIRQAEEEARQAQLEASRAKRRRTGGKNARR